MLAATLGYDNRKGSHRPTALLFPFYLSIILSGASLYELARAFLTQGVAGNTRHTARHCRVLAVFVSTVLSVSISNLSAYMCRLLVDARVGHASPWHQEKWELATGLLNQNGLPTSFRSW